MENKYLTDEEEAEYFKSDKFKEDVRKTIEEDTWGKGRPMIYLDKEGNIVEHWKDGTVNILHTKEELDRNKIVNTYKNY